MTDWNNARSIHKYEICFVFIAPTIKDMKGMKIYRRNSGMKNQ
jgi:hypothetical protein